MPVIDITLYETLVVDGVVQSDSTLITLQIDDANSDGAIDRTEWASYTDRPFGHLAGKTTPPMLFEGDTGQTTNGTLYSPVAYVEGQDISAVLRDLDKNRYEPTLTSLNICYLAGTMIATPSGDVAVETLRPGDLVLTLDHGPQPLVWTHATEVTPADLDLAPNKRPVRIAAGSLGAGLPARDVDVSPQHRVLVRDGDGGEHLISARHLMMAALPGVSLRPVDGSFQLVHIAFADHQIVLAEGAPMESFFTGKMAVRALSVPQRLSLIARFPRVAHGENPMTPARPFITHRDYARILAVPTRD
ncbi:Hint domain-containing protein [Paracoccus salsus]|uniref:Hint domain-containing protein n=1 Tax=Paracoccus salsus TaxID=2911061 RepID=UPI001F3FFD7C|nr:Hint domain-containing protein [Paracoccus salsus]MCF3973793.1 Hint domain-containing protein [Paracoccus salsus]